MLYRSADEKLYFLSQVIAKTDRTYILKKANDSDNGLRLTMEAFYLLLN